MIVRRSITSQESAPLWLRVQVELSPLNFVQLVLPNFRGEQLLFQDVALSVPALLQSDLIGAAKDLGSDGGYFTATGFRKPLFQSYSGALFDGIDDRLKKVTADLSQPARHVAYARMTGTGFNCLFSSNENNFNTRHEVLYNSFASNWRAWAGSSPGFGIAQPNIPAAGQDFYRHLLIVDGSDSYYEITDQSGNVVALFEGALGISPMNGGITLGGLRDDSITNDFFQGEILSYARFDRVLDSNEISYLKNEVAP